MGDAAAQALPPRMSYPSEPQNEHSDAAVSRRAAVLEETLDEANPGASAFADEFIAKADEHWVSCNGARIVARAWTDPEFRARLLANGREAIMELGLAMPPRSVTS
jgi:nitrile hydratase subunit alpha